MKRLVSMKVWIRFMRSDKKDLKIIIGDINAKIGQKEMDRPYKFCMF